MHGPMNVKVGQLYSNSKFQETVTELEQIKNVVFYPKV